MAVKKIKGTRPSRQPAMLTNRGGKKVYKPQPTAKLGKRVGTVTQASYARSTQRAVRTMSSKKYKRTGVKTGFGTSAAIQGRRLRRSAGRATAPARQWVGTQARRLGNTGVVRTLGNKYVRRGLVVGGAGLLGYGLYREGQKRPR